MLLATGKSANSRFAVIIREKEPANLEMPFTSLDGFITPNEQFYVRCHFPIPEIDARSWRLKIEGAVDRPFALSYDEMCQMKSHTITATLECAGNSRVFLVPKVKGVQWQLGAVGNAEWTGVFLRDLFQQTGMRNDAREIILEGADNGAIAEPPRPDGKIHFARSLPIEKAMDDVLLAFQMNGEQLSAAHGFPLRAIVPGWYAMASIKWLQRIIVTEKSYNGYYQTVDYARWERTDSGPVLVPITEMQVKAEIARPEINEVINAGESYRVRGSAWSAQAEIAQVELSTDGGASWQLVRLKDPSKPNAWRLWEFEWRTPTKPGRYTLLARATDSRGRTQPDKRNSDCGTYMINHCLPIEVEIR
jgi:DMSO/TMAO reductase YedYZ molybdopterin-dependent catalytic subunit